ncbi:ATP-dependent helicase [Entomospira entomophila]|uniref:DNA 3'-5' helicase n=1 Tax=Entomospira entomophila TaxID=2719988 RepID=A0A968GAD1_9SPIO|nr:ATP-dependent helicase [Entomospira entomophilus]NIZ40852.1 ATP-dependent helicase [Entomospira entomophilus]WDI35064.1 ATP-dependent helicase [Entomospira entomophilus]
MQPNTNQLSAITSVNRRSLVLAGAGSGKTHVITQRILHLIDNFDIAPHKILALTFTNKAAKEMEQRFITLQSKTQAVSFTTFHSFGAKFLRQYGHYIKLNRFFSIYDDTDQIATLKQLYPDEPQSQLIEWRYYINRAKDYALTIDEFHQVHQNPAQFQRIFQSYQAQLRHNNSVDFGDLLYLPLLILQQNPDLQQSVRQQWKAILVDEYQDTNRTQSALLENIMHQETFLMVVGDEDQSIYNFRGADTTAILTFSERFAPVELIKLEENYRSEAHILATANQLIQHNTQRLGKHLFTQKPPLAEKVEIHQFSTEEEEARWIIHHIEENIEYSEIAILYRTNAQSRIFEKLLTEKRIPYQIIGSIKFFAREEVKLSIAVLTILINPADEIAFRRILTTPSRGIGKKSIDLLMNYHENQSVTSLLESSIQAPVHKKAMQALQLIYQVYHQLQQNLGSSEPLSHLFMQLMTELGIIEYYTAKDLTDGTDRLQNIYEIKNLLSPYENSTESLGYFLESINLQSEAVDSSTPQARIKLITIHNTKGLEYDSVFVTGMEQQLFPKIDPYDPGGDAELEEERRLCYVAITRAKKHLFLSYAQRRYLHGRSLYQTPSQFLHELYNDTYVSTTSHITNSPTSASESYTPAQETFMVGRWVRDEDYGVGVILNCTLSKAGHLVLTIEFKDKVATFLPEFRYLEPVIMPDTN